MTKEEALAKYLNEKHDDNLTAEDICLDYDTTYKTPYGTFSVCTDEEADEAMRDDIENIIDDIGIYDTFGENSRDYIIDNFCSWEQGEECFEEDYMSYFDDISYETANKPVFCSRQQEELWDIVAEKLYDSEPSAAELISFVEDYEIKKDEYIDMAIEQFKDDIDNDYIGWARDNFGEEEIKHLAEQGELQIDYKGIAEYIADVDGRGPTLSSWDGYEIDLTGSDYYAYMIDDDCMERNSVDFEEEEEEEAEIVS